MSEDTFKEAMNLKTSIDFIRRQNEDLNEAKKALISSEKRPEDIIKFVTRLMELQFGDYVFEDVVFGLIKHNEMKIEELQDKFNSL